MFEVLLYEVPQLRVAGDLPGALTAPSAFGTCAGLSAGGSCQRVHECSDGGSGRHDSFQPSRPAAVRGDCTAHDRSDGKAAANRRLCFITQSWPESAGMSRALKACLVLGDSNRGSGSYGFIQDYGRISPPRRRRDFRFAGFPGVADRTSTDGPETVHPVALVQREHEGVRMTLREPCRRRRWWLVGVILLAGLTAAVPVAPIVHDMVSRAVGRRCGSERSTGRTTLILSAWTRRKSLPACGLRIRRNQSRIHYR